MNLFWIFFGAILTSGGIFVTCIFSLVFLIRGMVKNYKNTEKKEKIIVICVLTFLIAFSVVSGYFSYCNTFDYILKDFKESEGVVKSISSGRYGTRSIEIDNSSYNYPKILKDRQAIINKRHKFLYAKRTKKILNILPIE